MNEEAREDRSVVRAAAMQWRGGSWHRLADLVTGEEALEIRLGGRMVAMTMRTPPGGEDEEGQADVDLAIGFLLSERIIATADAIERVERKSADVLNLIPRPGAPIEQGRIVQRAVVTASCGVCARLEVTGPSMEGVRVEEEAKFDAAVVAGAPAKLRAAQKIFNQTGGVHAAALVDARGELLHLSEDIGRHNAVDRLIGQAARAGRLPLRGVILVVSGRVSWEIVQKGAAAGVSVIAAISAVSSLAIDAARDAGITLTGFVRDGAMNVYTCPSRLSATPITL